MKLIKHLFASCSIISLFATNFQSQAALTYNVSAGAGNDIGVFSGFASSYWTSGDIVLPTGTTIEATPLEIDLNLSHDVTLDTSGHYSWFLNYATPIAPNDNLGILYMVLSHNGVPVTSQIGFDAGANSFGAPNAPFSVSQFGTGGYDDQLKNLVFNGVVIYVSNSDPNTENLANVRISLDAVPEPNTIVAGALMLLPFGVSTIRMLRKNRTA